MNDSLYSVFCQIFLQFITTFATDGKDMEYMGIPIIHNWCDDFWIGDMVNNILIEVLGAVAEQERKKTRKRQSEGIAAMPVVDGRRVSARTGRGFGRPASVVDPVVFENLRKKQKDGLMTVSECCEELGISRSTWYDMGRRGM